VIIDLPLFFGTTLSIASFYLTSQREIAGSDNHKFELKATLRQLPLVMSIGIGLCINQTRAVLEAMLASTPASFVRTPQARRGRQAGEVDPEALPRDEDRRAYLEIAFALYFAVALVAAGMQGHYLSMPFLLLFLVGFGYVGTLSLHQSR